MFESANKGTFEFFYNKPNKSDPEGTKTKFSNAFAIQRQHPDVVEYVLEGIGCEDESLTLKILEWSSPDAYTKFPTWEKFPDFVKAQEGAWLGPPTFASYNFPSPFPLKPTPPIIEHLLVPLKPDISYDAFEEEFVKAMRHVATCHGCKGFTLGRQTEDPTKALLIVGWETLEDHTEGLAKNEVFPAFQAEMGTVLEKYVVGSWGGLQMSHFKTCEPWTGV